MWSTLLALGGLGLGLVSSQDSVVECDIIIVGGSAGALGAALAAAEDNVNLRVCLTEPTDWLGGQLTSSGVSAIDFGDFNANWWFQSRRLADMMSSLGSGNPGKCWVSIKCFEPLDLLNGWIQSAVSRLPNLSIFYNAVPVRVSKIDGVIHSVTLVQRSPIQEPWQRTLSEEIEDWYSPVLSPFFDKVVVTLQGSVMIEASEYGEVLSLSGASYSIGVEAPDEESFETIQECGQCVTFPFGMISEADDPGLEVPDPGGSFDLQGFNFSMIWTYRRIRDAGTGALVFNLGDISNQNWGGGNDFCGETLFLNKSQVEEQTLNSNWTGGVKVDVLSEAEDRAFGWFHHFKNNSPTNIRDNLKMTSKVFKTGTGLAKAPYLRDGRRSIGIGGFRLSKRDMESPVDPLGVPQTQQAASPEPLPPSMYSTRFNDSIGLGDYFYADLHRLSGCSYPPYISESSIYPFHLPFRALTNQDYVNLLVVGKSMAQTFHAQTASRMHPSDFTSGEAAGVAASLMVTHNWTTSVMLDNISVLQDKLRVDIPIYWDEPRMT